MIRIWKWGLALALAASSVGAEPIVFNAVYADATGTGFLAAGAVGAQRRLAFEAALTVYEGYFEASYVGEFVNVQASFGATGFLAEAGPYWVGRDFAGMVPSTWYGGALAAHVNAQDLSFFPTEPHIAVTFNPDFIDGAGSEFYFGLDGNPDSDEFDLISLTIHEVAHGLGFQTEIAGADGSWIEDFPGIYDRFVYDPGSGLTLAEMTDAQRAAAITSDSLVWIGAHAIAANGGVEPKLYAPGTYIPGSSVAHLDFLTFGPGDMSPFLFPGTSQHGLSAVSLGILQDVGWSVVAPVPEPGTWVLLGAAAVVLIIRRRRAGNSRAPPLN